LKVPDPREFSRLVESLEKRHEITECVYRGVLSNFETIKLCNLNKEHVARILQPFFLTWGVMTRVLGYKGCEKIGEKLKAMNTQLLRFRKKDLLTTDLKKLAEEITEIYEEIKNTRWRSKKGKDKRVGPTSAAKALHLIAPELFMMWDRDIRGRYHFKESGAEYVRFLFTMQNWLKELEPTIERLKHQYRKSGPRIIDEYNWMKAHTEE